ncbi:unnamed protein product [Brassica oleracea]|uniref:Uncharacterized protein n=1 Tax=Brassica oleracea TaxID=3712 RepID=A0A3P6AAX6_BRAOL|nr:unnamed protein product [Brassica oleracea]
MGISSWYSQTPLLRAASATSSHPSAVSFFLLDQTRRSSKRPMKKILALIPTRLFWLSPGGHKNKVKKLSASSESLSERVLIDENEYHMFKFQTKGKVIKRFSSFDSSIDHHPSTRRSQSTSCFGIRIW